MTERPIIPPPPTYPPSVGLPAPAPDWWVELYGPDEPGTSQPAGADRLPRWWEKKTLLGLPTSKPNSDEDDPEEDEAEDAPEEPEEDEADEPDAKSGSARKGNAAKKPGKKRRSAVRDDRGLRVIAFNGLAAGVGYGVGLVPVFGQWLPAAEQGATGMVGLALAAGGAVAAWRLTGNPAVRAILPYVPVARTLISIGAAELGRRWAPVPVDWLNEHGAAWGLGASAVSLLLTAGGMCGGLWWLVDRRARAWHWTARLVVRIPLASALLATALYAPGATS